MGAIGRRRRTVPDPFRRAGTTREAADEAVASLDIHELPAARGCTYVVPANDFALALKAGESAGGAEMKIASKLGVTEKEVDKFCEAVLRALEAGLLDPDEIRAATGKASRNLGEEGKKKGMVTTLSRWLLASCRPRAIFGEFRSAGGSTSSATGTHSGVRIRSRSLRCLPKK